MARIPVVREVTTTTKMGLNKAIVGLVLVVLLNDIHFVNAWMTSLLQPVSRKTTCSYFIKSKQQHCSSSSSSSSSSIRQTLLSSTTESASSSSTTTSTGPGYKINPMLSQIKPSKTVEIFSLVKSMEASGDIVTSLCVGEPDFPPPQQVLDATINAVQGPNCATRYTAVTGTFELRTAIANDLQRRKNIRYDPTNEIVVGNGAKQSVFQAIWATVGTGDKVLIPAPYWPSYPEEVLLTGAVPIIVPTTASTGYLLTPEQLRSTLAVHPDISLMILCNPSNPTGGVYEEDALKELCSILVNEFPHVRVLADEIYERLIYDDVTECPSVASMPGMWERTLTVNGFSKAYAMTGYRLGYVAAPKQYAKAISTIQGQLTSCAGSISQAAGVAALTQVPDSVLRDNAIIMQQKRDYVLKEIQTIPNVHIAVPPKGAFYVLPDISYYCSNNQADDDDDDDEQDAELCIELLQQYKLAVVPGSSFGAPGTIRLSYATSMEELEIAMTKLRNFFADKQKQMNNSN